MHRCIFMRGCTHAERKAVDQGFGSPVRRLGLRLVLRSFFRFVSAHSTRFVSKCREARCSSIGLGHSHALCSRLRHSIRLRTNQGATWEENHADREHGRNCIPNAKGSHLWHVARAFFTGSLGSFDNNKIIVQDRSKLSVNYLLTFNDLQRANWV